MTRDRCIIFLAVLLAGCRSAPLQPMVVAHRGGAMEVPENTLAAFQELSASPETTVEIIRRHQPKTWQILAATEGTEPGGSGD